MHRSRVGIVRVNLKIAPQCAFRGALHDESEFVVTSLSRHQARAQQMSASQSDCEHETREWGRRVRDVVSAAPPPHIQREPIEWQALFG